MKSLEPYKDIKQNKTNTCSDELATTEEKLVSKWRKKGGGKAFPIALKVDNEQFLIDTATSDGTSTDKYTAIAASLCGASGSLDTLFALKLIQQYACVLDLDGNTERAAEASNSFINTMAALQPEDEIEGMLLTQILSLHVMGMKSASRAANLNNSTLNVDRNVNNMTKLLRLQHEAIEKLFRYRRKGSQQVIVQHVNVNDGGQAVVGGAFDGGGKKSKI